MKNLIRFYAIGMIGLMVVPISVGAFDAEGRTKIADASSGPDWIEVEVEPENILPEEQYFVECQTDDGKISASRVAFDVKRTLRIDGLISSATYKCTVGLFVEAQDVVRYRSAVVSIKTGAVTDFVTSSRQDVDADEISFWLNETPLNYEDEYYVECKDGFDNKQTVHSTNPSGLRLRGLLSDHLYSCRAGLIRDQRVHKAGEPFELKTKISPYQLMTITKYEKSDTSVTFWLGGPKAEPDEKYYVNCDEELNRSMQFQENDLPVEIVVSRLKPNTSYSCYAAIVTASDKIRSKGSVVWLRTEPLDTSKVYINSFTVGNDSVMFQISGPSLDINESFYVNCEDADGNAYFGKSGFSSDLRLSGLMPEMKYICYGAVTNDISNIISLKGPTMEVTTKKSVRDTDEKPFAPAGAFDDAPIKDWNDYQNPFPDTGLELLSGRAAAELRRRDVIGGYPDGEFKGSRDVNRAEAAKFLLIARYADVVDSENSGKFADVEAGVWYTKYVMKAAELGIIDGYPDGFFRPANSINRAEFLKMISKTFALEENLAVGFQDVPADAWFAKYAGAAGKYNLFPATDTNNPQLFPEQKMSRYDVAIAIYQYLLNR